MDQLAGMLPSVVQHFGWEWLDYSLLKIMGCDDNVI